MQVLKSSFRGPRRSFHKVIDSLIAEIGLNESFDIFARKEITLMELKCLVKTRLCVRHYEEDGMSLIRNRNAVFTRYVQDETNKMTTSNRLKFKLVSGTHGLR
eukprot:Awhi_evm1s12704